MSSMTSRAARLIQAGLALLLLAAVGLNCANIVFRYFFDFSLLASDELQVFAMVLITFLGAITVSMQGQHLCMDVLAQAASGRARRILALCEALVTIAAAGLMAWASASFVARLFGMGQRSGMADLPMWIPHGAVTLGFGAIALLALARAGRLLAGREEGK